MFHPWHNVAFLCFFVLLNYSRRSFAHLSGEDLTIDEEAILAKRDSDEICKNEGICKMVQKSDLLNNNLAINDSNDNIDSYANPSINDMASQTDVIFDNYWKNYDADIFEDILDNPEIDDSIDKSDSSENFKSNNGLSESEHRERIKFNFDITDINLENYDWENTDDAVWWWGDGQPEYPNDNAEKFENNDMIDEEENLKFNKVISLTEEFRKELNNYEPVKLLPISKSEIQENGDENEFENCAKSDGEEECNVTDKAFDGVYDGQNDSLDSDHLVKYFREEGPKSRILSLVEFIGIPGRRNWTYRIDENQNQEVDNLTKPSIGWTYRIDEFENKNLGDNIVNRMPLNSENGDIACPQIALNNQKSEDILQNGENLIKKTEDEEEEFTSDETPRPRISELTPNVNFPRLPLNLEIFDKDVEFVIKKFYDEMEKINEEAIGFQK